MYPCEWRLIIPGVARSVICKAPVLKRKFALISDPTSMSLWCSFCSLMLHLLAILINRGDELHHVNDAILIRTREQFSYGIR